ncbi:hypothetical protein BDY19DRAFT_950949 [Irpex rosettiformis]|uniref:Uncharacterized protein n=1 Tax=Irpex rosettiformis TaxID=378272 RepID=A0ACB8U2X7_9APHY|nr:hypothetical protein BDY19DRAFT_950949 [Irpex rosettiformis]
MGIIQSMAASSSRHPLVDMFTIRNHIPSLGRIVATRTRVRMSLFEIVMASLRWRSDRSRSRRKDSLLVSSPRLLQGYVIALPCTCKLGSFLSAGISGINFKRYCDTGKVILKANAVIVGFLGHCLSYPAIRILVDYSNCRTSMLIRSLPQCCVRIKTSIKLSGNEKSTISLTKRVSILCQR